MLRAEGEKRIGGGRPTQPVLHVYPPDSRKVPVPQTAPPHLQKADAALFVTFCTAARVNLPALRRATWISDTVYANMA